MNKEKIMQLIRDGEFTLLYHDNGHCCIYKGKYKDYSDVPENATPLLEFENESDGYLPAEVKLLVEALGGECDSI